jgi:CDP-glucose 4,6-dehydratase
VIGGGDFAVNRLIPDCARAAFRNEPIQIRNPDAIRPYQHVLDTLSAYLLIAQRQYEASTYAGSYNIGPDENDCRTSAELAAMFCEAWGGGQYWERVTVDNPHEDNTLRLDCTKIRRILGWRPRWAVKDAIVKTAEWYRAYNEHGDVAAVMERQIFEFSAGNALP